MRAWLQRLGAALFAPRWLAVKLLDQKPGRGSTDVLLVLLLFVVFDQSPRLVTAFAAAQAVGVGFGASQALLVLQGAVPVIAVILALGIVASVVLGWGQDTKADPRRSDFGLDVAAYAALPYVVLRIVEAHVWPLFDINEPRLRTRLLSAAPFALWTLVLVVYWVRALRRAAPTRAPAPPRLALITGGVIAALLFGAAIRPAQFAITHYADLAHVAAKRGEPAPGWTLPTLDGDRVSLEAEHGRVVVLVFWATWCGVCKQELPLLEKLYTRLDKDKVRLYTVSTEGRSEDTKREIVAVKQRLGLTMPVLLDDGQVAGQYNVTSIPHLVFISPSGKVTKMAVGMTTISSVEAAISDAAERP